MGSIAMTDTSATYETEPAIAMTDTSATYETEPAIAVELSPLEQMNLDVAAIAGWENVEPWNLKLPKRVYVGTNKKHPDLGIFVPNYVSDLNAITKVFDRLNLGWTLSSLGYASCSVLGAYAETPAIALCKLLLELSPQPQVQVIDDNG
jgi:hypothetical protein